MSETTSGISRSSRRRGMSPEERKKKKMTQIAGGVLVFILVCVIAYIAQQQNPMGAFIVFIGTAFGYVLQRSRFCFTAALRDPVLTGGTNLTKAVIIGLAAISLLFMALNMAKFGIGLENLDLSIVAGNVKSVGVHTVIGAFLFGIGAVIAGGCASGTMMRMGEGFVQQWLVFVFFVTGSTLGLFASKVIVSESAPKVFLPQVLGGWLPAAIIHFGLLFVLYLAADAWGRKKAKES